MAAGLCPDSNLNDVLVDKSNVSTPGVHEVLKTATKSVAEDMPSLGDNLEPRDTTKPQEEVAANSPSKKALKSPTKRVIKTPVKSSNKRHSTSPLKFAEQTTGDGKAAKEMVVGGTLLEEEDVRNLDVEMAENISPRKRPATGAKEEPADNKFESKRTRFVRKTGHVPAVPHFTSPVLWSLDAGTDATALHVGEHRCIVGTADGAVLTLDLSGKPVRVQKLPIPIGTLMQDGDFLYAWCPNKHGFQKWKGALYDLTSEMPRMQFEVEDLGEWLNLSCMHDGMLILSDDKGNLFKLGPDGEVIWRVEAESEIASKMLLVDDSGIYIGYRKKITKVSLKDGSLIWEHQAPGRFANVQNGTQDAEHVYAEVSGRIIKLSKEDGSLQMEYVPARHRASGIAIGNGLLITGSCPTAIFDLKMGDEKYRMNFAGRLQDAVIQMHPNGRLYAAWDKIYCIDIAEEALTRAMAGRSTRTVPMSLDGATCVHAADIIPMTTQSQRGVRVECFLRNGKPVVRACSEEYDDCWPVHIPVSYMIPGKQFMCDKLVPNKTHLFYRAHGDVYELVTVDQMKEALNSPAKMAEEAGQAIVTPSKDEIKNNVHQGNLANENCATANGDSTGDAAEPKSSKD